MPEILSIRGLTSSYGEVVALRDIDLRVDSGETVALVGANGAGKSTLLKSIMGLVHVRSGSISFAGAPIGGLSPDRRARLGLGYCPEGRNLFPMMTVRDNLEVACWLPRAERHRRVNGVLDIFPQLAEREDALSWQLSGGQQQMLAIGRALMGGPKLLLLDEPSLGLSPLLVSEVFRTIARIVQEGVTVLIAEQNASKALLISHRAYVLKLGEVVLDGPAAELRENVEVRHAYLGG